MTVDVLVTKENNKLYTARVLLLPDIVVTGHTEDEVLEQVKSAIHDLRTTSRIVHLEVPSISQEKNDPWLQFAGSWADDPDWDIFQTEVEAFRQEMNTQTETIIT